MLRANAIEASSLWLELDDLMLSLAGLVLETGEELQVESTPPALVWRPGPSTLFLSGEGAQACQASPAFAARITACS
eukprot:SAG11_NODE_4009_length_2109_cov_1.126866_2_plen_77_part_00